MPATLPRPGVAWIASPPFMVTLGANVPVIGTTLSLVVISHFTGCGGTSNTRSGATSACATRARSMRIETTQRASCR